MNLFQAVNDAMSIALATDDNAGKHLLFQYTPISKHEIILMLFLVFSGLW